jgi:hypothetical protein
MGDGASDKTLYSAQLMINILVIDTCGVMTLQSCKYDMQHDVSCQRNVLGMIKNVLKMHEAFK